MRFAVGYQLADEHEQDSFVKLVSEYRPHIAEVYFAWMDQPSGRSAVATPAGAAPIGRPSAGWKRICGALRGMGVSLDLLLNANCYGGRAISQHLENQIGSLLDYLGERVGGGGCGDHRITLHRAHGEEAFPQHPDARLG